jgi:carboxymethylenebutenolidase
LAKEGYAVLGFDPYDGQVATTIEEAKRLRRSMDRKVINQELKSAVADLREHTGQKIGVLGFSMGANLALWTMDNCSQDVGATVLYYGTSGGRFRRTKSAVLGHFAERDPYARAEQVSALRSRLQSQNIPHAVYVYSGAQHWFMEDGRPEYDPESASLAWERSIKFLHSSLQGQGGKNSLGV